MGEDPNDQLLLQIRGAVSEYERSLIAERMRRGRQHKYRAGLLLPWTRPPYGYRLDPDHPRDPAGVRVEATEGAIGSLLFARYAQPGQSLSSLSTYLKQLSVPTPTNKKRWSNATLRRILTNPVYIGVVYAGRGRVQPAKRRRSALAPVGQRMTTSMPTSPDQWIVVGHIPALVTQQSFEQVQAKLTTNQQFARRNNRAQTYLLRALVSCGCCQLACSGQTRRGYSYYACVGKAHPSRSGREEKCRNRLIAMKQLDAVVWADLSDLLLHPEAICQALQRAQSGEWLPQELQARREGQRKARVTLSHHIDRLTEAYLERIVTLEEYRRRRRGLEERAEAIEAQMRQLEANIDRQRELMMLAEAHRVLLPTSPARPGSSHLRRDAASGGVAHRSGDRDKGRGRDPLCHSHQSSGRVCAVLSIASRLLSSDSTARLLRSACRPTCQALLQRFLNELPRTCPITTRNGPTRRAPVATNPRGWPAQHFHCCLRFPRRSILIAGSCRWTSERLRARSEPVVI
jgi:hypothetical protein